MSVKELSSCSGITMNGVYFGGMELVDLITRNINTALSCKEELRIDSGYVVAVIRYIKVIAYTVGVTCLQLIAHIYKAFAVIHTETGGSRHRKAHSCAALLCYMNVKNIAATRVKRIFSDREGTDIHRISVRKIYIGNQIISVKVRTNTLLLFCRDKAVWNNSYGHAFNSNVDRGCGYTKASACKRDCFRTAGNAVITVYIPVEGMPFTVH